MLAILLSLVFSSAHAAVAIYDDASVEGIHYHCSNLKGALVIKSDGGVMFVFPEPRPATVANEVDRKMLPSGKGGTLLFLSAWAAGTVVRLPDVARQGVASFRLSSFNWSYMGHGEVRGTGTCTRVDGRGN